MDTGLYKANENHGVKIFRLKSLSAEGLAKIGLLITKEEKEAYIIHTSKVYQQTERPLGNL